MADPERTRTVEGMHPFVGRQDRWCEQCHRPDRDPIHAAANPPDLDQAIHTAEAARVLREIKSEYIPWSHTVTALEAGADALEQLQATRDTHDCGMGITATQHDGACRAHDAKRRR